MTTENIDDGNPDNDSVVLPSIRIVVNGAVVSADSGEFTTDDCIIDPAFNSDFLCDSLPAGASQAITLTWNNPRPGTFAINFNSACLLLPSRDRCPTAFATWPLPEDTVIGIEPPTVAITSPVEGSILDTSPVDISGTFTGDVFSVDVNGVQATLGGGTFTANTRHHSLIYVA